MLGGAASRFVSIAMEDKKLQAEDRRLKETHRVASELQSREHQHRSEDLKLKFEQETAQQLRQAQLQRQEAERVG